VDYQGGFEFYDKGAVVGDEMGRRDSRSTGVSEIGTAGLRAGLSDGRSR
jgi:hypothetical protein